MPKKKFIDKKNSVTFYLTHRPQRDPLAADENAPKNILVPMDQMPNMGGQSGYPSTSTLKKYDQDDDDNDSCGPSKTKKNKNKDEEVKFGIYFDDEYDYLQHLKDSNEISNIEWDYSAVVHAERERKLKANNKNNEESKLQLPSSMFESEHREDIGLLNKAAPSTGPRPDLDPDIIEALDDDFDFENPDNILDDNFIELANQKISADGQGENDEDDDDENYEDEENDTIGSLNGDRDSEYSYDNDNKSSRFTNYSMTSSVVPRSEQLSILDDRFEKMFEGYEDTEIGALDCEEIEGDVLNPDSILKKLADEYENQKGIDLNEKIARLAVQDNDEESSTDSDESSSDDELKLPQKKWDCDSIISTYSNKYNRPKLIKEIGRIKISRGMPQGVLGKGLTAQNLKKLDKDNEKADQDSDHDDDMSITSSRMTNFIRNKDETTEERRLRKKLVREIRKERREEKKANTEAFKDEKKRQEKLRLNAKVNLPGLKL